MRKASRKQDLYEITGIADIVRGASDPRETLGAQKIKGQFASLRLESRQNEVSRYCRDIVRLMTEVIAENFMPETISKMSGVQVDEQVMSIIKDDTTRSFAIDIETDSTLRIDQEEDKQARIEFLGAVSNFMPQAIQAIQVNPDIAPLMGEMLLFAVRGFRVGRELEDDFAKMIEGAKAGGQPQQQKPDPKTIEAQSRARERDQKMQMEAAEFKQDFAQKKQAHDLDIISAEQKIRHAQESHKIKQ